MAPAFASILGIDITLPPGLDTDAFGTFTREVPRTAGMRETARRKAWAGIAATGLPLGLASEGSFGPHPAIPFIACGCETLAFIDAERGLEIVEERMSERTNFATFDLAPGADLEAYLTRVGFPGHALIVRVGDRLHKGVQARAELDRMLADGRPVMLEADMRAHMNPTRMHEISLLAERLARRIATPCPACAAPGFGTVRSEAGLPCGECGAPSAVIIALVDQCSACAFEQRRPRPDGRSTATPAECPECNP